MRKCDSCGYLLLGDGDVCNHCQAPLPKATVGAPLASAPAATPTVAPGPVQPPQPTAPPAPIAPPAPGLWSERATRAPGPSFAAPPPAAARPREVWNAQAEPVIRTAPTRKSNRFPAAALVIALICGVAGYWYISHRNSVPAGTSAFVAGHGVSYVAADGSYSAQFPSAPLVESHPINVQSISANIVSASVTTDDYELGTASMTLPVVVPANRADELLDDALKGGLDAASSGDLISKQHIMRGGLKAVEATFKAKDGYTAHALVMTGGNHLYLLFVHARTGTNALYQALDKSFIPSLSM